MRNRKTIILILWILIGIIAVVATMLYFTMPQWKGFFFACAGGVLIINLLVSMFFVHKNFKD